MQALVKDLRIDPVAEKINEQEGRYLDFVISIQEENGSEIIYTYPSV